MKHDKITAKGRYVPTRMCIACRGFFPQAQLLRVCKQADGTVIADAAHKKGGRGVYVCKQKACIEKAQLTRGFERGLQCQVPQQVYEECMQFGE